MTGHFLRRSRLSGHHFLARCPGPLCVVPYLVPLAGRYLIVSITASEARRRLFPLIEEVNSDHTAVEIVSKNSSAYLVSAAEYESLQETAYLLRTPANARRLLRSYQEAIDGRHEQHELIDPEDIP